MTVDCREQLPLPNNDPLLAYSLQLQDVSNRLATLILRVFHS